MVNVRETNREFFIAKEQAELGMSMSETEEVVEEHGLCLSCLLLGHPSKSHSRH